MTLPGTIRPGNVPTSRVGPILASLVAERWPEWQRRDGELGGCEILAEKIGCHADTVDNIARQRSPGISFDLADKLFCALNRQDIWRGELADIYLNLTFMETCELHSCGKVFPENPGRGNRQRFCSAKCRNLAKEVRLRGRPGTRNIQRGLFRCGHKITPENTVWIADGKRTCRTCRKVKMRGWQKAHRARKKERPLAV